MFSTLRQGASIYVLDKGKNPQLKIGQVESVSTPQPRISSYGYNTDMVMDIKVKVGDETLDFQKLPINMSSAPIGNLVVCDNRDEILAAVDNFMQNSKQILENIDYHRTVVEACDKMLIQLNPGYAKDRERDTAIENVKAELAEVRGEFRGAMSEIKSLLSLYAPSSGNHVQK